MKAFVVLALVACAAARSVDLDTLRFLTKEPGMMGDLILKDKLMGHRFNIPLKKNWNTPFNYEKYNNYYNTPSVFDDFDVDTWTQRRVTVLPIEELVAHPLFREYLNIPLFRQFWEQYPVVFRKYVESPLFQQFWTHPQFIQYFRNPVLFYKYIVPQVQIIAHRVVPSTYDYNTFGYNYDVQDYIRRPFVDREVVVGDYLNKIFGDRYTTPYPYTTTPYGYTPYNVFGGRHSTYGINTGVNYKFLLDKIYRTLFVNKPVIGEMTQVKTDVKVAPAHKEVVVEPTTGEAKVVVEPPKIVDVKVDEKVIPQETEREVIEKEILLKKLLVTKRITPELYQVLKTLPIYHVKEIVRRIVRHNVVDIDEFTLPTHLNEYDVNVEDYLNTVDPVYKHKINEILGQLYNKDIVGDRYTPVARDLMKVLGRHQYETLDDIVRV